MSINRLKKNRINVIKDIIPLMLFFSFMLFFFAPFEIYLSNKGYFFFPGTDMLGIATGLSVIAFVLTILILWLLGMISKKVFAFLYGGFFGGTVALYLQGNWDTTDYGAWNGSEIDWSLYRPQFCVFLAVFIVLIVGCGIFSLYKYELFLKISKTASCFITAILIITLVVLTISNGGLKKGKEYICTTEGELDLSSDKNMIILILDAFDSSAYKEITEGEDGELYRYIFTDFTYFPDTVTGYSSTDMSLPLIITGKGYKNEKLFGDYLNEAYSGSKLMKWLDDNGWEKDIYTDSLMPQGEEGFGVANSKLLERVASDRRELMYYMYTMVTFRYMPQPIKNHFYFYADNIKGNLNMVKGDYEPYGGDDLRFMEKISELTTDKKKSVFQFIHIEGAHEPFTITADLTQTDETDYEEECKASLKITEDLIQELKDKEIYDNTIVIVMADHGYSNGRQNPLLLIKGIDEHHPYMISDKAVSYYDLQDAYIELLDNKACSTDIFKDMTDVMRERYYCTVPFNTHLNYDTYGGGMREYVIKGHAWDQGAASKTGIMYEEKEEVDIR